MIDSFPLFFGFVNCIFEIMKKFILLKILILFTGKVICDNVGEINAPSETGLASSQSQVVNNAVKNAPDIIHYGNSGQQSGGWQVIPDRDLAGGVIRVSGDGPKPDDLADPVVDVGLETYISAKRITSHPNYIHLSQLSECGFPAIMDQYDRDDEVKQYTGEFTDKETRVKRIVGGNQVKPQRHPWMIQLYFFNISSTEHSFHCAGTLISNRTILTAAHCLTRLGPATTLDVVVIGNYDRRKVIFCKTSDPQENCSRSLLWDIEDFEVHEAYSEGNLNHDIALIYLKKPIKVNARARPICLPYSSDLLEKWNDLKLTALGWGSTNKFGSQGVYLSDLLKQVQFDLQPRSLCDKFHQRIYGKIKFDRICTGGNIGRASCNGDSGGAVVKALEIKDMNGVKIERVFQFGVVSAGGHPVETCGSQGRPAIDTNVFFFMDWILNNIIPGVQSYTYVDSLTTPYWAEISSSTGYKTLNMPATVFKGKLDANGNVQPDYLNEFSTGLDVNVAEHPNIKLLPAIKDCGNLPVWNENVFSEHDSTTRTTRGTKGILEAHMESIRQDEDVVIREKRIVGGVPVNLEGYFPWMVQIYVRNVESDDLGFRCSGTIISQWHVITAAHCITEIIPPFVLDSVIVGQYNRNHTEECVEGECYKPLSLKVTGVLIHPDYEKYTRKNNIALMRLSEKLNYSRFISPICLPRKERLINAIEVKRYFSAGWGRVQRDSNSPADNKMSEILLRMYVELLPRRDCDFVYSRSIDMLDRSRLCGGGKASQGECLGDGGSPLMKKMIIQPGHLLHNKYFQFGFVAFADCGLQGMPTVYTNIIYYMEWILDNLENPDLIN